MTQITDEMVDVAYHAIKLADVSEHTHHRLYRLALTAAYPLIRAAVLEEAAGVCEEMRKTLLDSQVTGSACMVAQDCAQAIRDMAKEG